MRKKEMEDAFLFDLLCRELPHVACCAENFPIVVMAKPTEQEIKEQNEVDSLYKQHLADERTKRKQREEKKERLKRIQMIKEAAARLERERKKPYALKAMIKAFPEKTEDKIIKFLEPRMYLLGKQTTQEVDLFVSRLREKNPVKPLGGSLIAKPEVYK